MPVLRSQLVDGAEEEDDRFETVDDRDGEPGDKVVITISAKEVKKAGRFRSGWQSPNV